MKCLECNREFPTERGLHIHVASHMTLPAYYWKHFPRKDLLTGDPIVFKNKELYLTRDFNSKKNMAKWLHNSNLDMAKNYISRKLSEYLVDEQERYNNSLAPCQIDTKVNEEVPSIVFTESLLNKSFDEFIVTVGFTPRFNYSNMDKINTFPSKDMVIAVDTREQKPLSFSCQTIRQKLDYGDYVALGKDYSGLFVERKSLSDLVSTISLGYERLKQEINRAATMKGYLVVVVEEPLNSALRFQRQDLMQKFVKATPAFIFHRIRVLMRENDNIQFLFTDSREVSSDIIPRLFKLGREGAKNLDLQYLYDSGVI